MKLTKNQKEVINKMEELVGKRLTLPELQDKIRDIFKNNHIEIEDITRKKDNDDLSDYNLLFSNETQNELYGYFDIYYLKTRNEGIMYITEIGYEFE